MLELSKFNSAAINSEEYTLLVDELESTRSKMEKALVEFGGRSVEVTELLTRTRQIQNLCSKFVG